jgi:cyclopropane fatty-acyl-phospholipid synthase-like methyltransferase
MKKEWFASWFDSAYYHLLYKHRNNEEAKLFIDNIIAFLQLKKNDYVVDIACGKGRHSIMMASHGLNVTGLDLSENSIAFAQQFSSETLQFAVHDMRRISRVNYYDAAFNLFTSFGYFNSVHDNKLAAKAMSASVKQNGFLVIDFLNVPSAKQNIFAKPYEEIIEGDIVFKVERNFTDNKFCKSIQVFENNEMVQQHTEQVNALQLTDFENYFSACGMQLQNVFGNYKLEPNTESSPRLIMVFKKMTT